MKPAHGTRARYNLSCRCLPCKYAASDYRRLYNTTGSGVRTVDAAPLRAHLVMLAASGVEIKAVAKLAGVAVTGLYSVKNGKLDKVRRATADAVMGIGAPDYSANARVPGSHARKIVADLNAHGVQNVEIAAALGYRSDHLNFIGHKWVGRRTVQRLRMVALLFQRAGRVPGEVLS